MAFNEDTRVKIPALLHLVRLGYTYLPLSNAKWDEETNIFTDIFKQSVLKLNPHLAEGDEDRLLTDVRLALDNEDLGRSFYQMLTATSGSRLIDFKDFKNNQFHVVTELTCKNGEDEFRPDITLLINGLPLAFIEVKKPNNREGVLAERDRIHSRFKNKKFKKFVNITQLLMFSNNMEYDTESIVPIQGAFYGTPSHGDVYFNCFREEENLDLSSLLQDENEEVENLLLRDTNKTVIKHSPEFITNKNPHSPTNRLLTSLFTPERFASLLQFGIAYVDGHNGLEKHVMRYPQFFATRRIKESIEMGIKKGIIWHTQGSGKTALAFYNTHFLTDYFSKKGVVPKFYFIVDRIDLLIQARDEFTSRGLEVHTVNSREELMNDFKLTRAIHGTSGKREITVVNIQKFEDDTDVLKAGDYDINVQRVYFLDEVHRSYDPSGSFLAGLINSDRTAIIIGLTGTPLIDEGRRSRDIFGDYIHKYYYNASIADGYTLKLIREGIETKYRIELEEAIKQIEILKGHADRSVIYSHEKFVAPMLNYIIDDFSKTRIRLGDATIGAMVVCDSSEQARELHAQFNAKFASEYTSALILHDEGDKDSRREVVNAFKAGKIDLLFVFNMLLTGFDAKRLKKLYLGRVIRKHNLLQTLTRVNRPYRDHRYGYVVDFADIRKEFDATNKAYFDELQDELGDEMSNYSDLFKSTEEIEVEIAEIKEALFHFDLMNAEVFSQQINQIDDRKEILTIKKALESAKNLYNIIRLYGHFELLDKLDFKKLNTLYNETSRRLELINLKDTLENDVDSTNLLNVALENVLFTFIKVSEDELVIADKLKDSLRKTREELRNNFDQTDPQFTSLYDELKRLFKKKNLDEVTQDDMKDNIGALQKIFDKVSELNRKNGLLKAKYESDQKYAKLHKRILERGITNQESAIHGSLIAIKHQADEKVLINTGMLDNEDYFAQMMAPIVIDGFEQAKVELDPESTKFINDYVVSEYVREFKGIPVW
jgi:type I restriction enzyme R subunit